MNMLKKQGVAWVITIVMIVAAIGIGLAKNSTADTPPMGPSQTIPPVGGQQDASQYVYDDASVLSPSEEKELSQLVGEMYADTGSAVACVITKAGDSDIYQFALDYAEDISLGGYDFIVVVDLKSMQYILVQGADLISAFTDSDCDDYAEEYLLPDLDNGDYGDGLVSLVKALYDWCQSNYR